jgi:hypothetical protein
MKRLLACLLVIASPALAQQVEPSPNEEALGNKLLAEMRGGIQCNASLILLQRQVKDLQAQLDAAKKSTETAPKN